MATPRRASFDIGRDARNTVVLRDDSVSSRHARIDVDEGGDLWLQDLGSRNGTFIGSGGGWRRLEGAPQRVLPSTFVVFGRHGIAVGDLLKGRRVSPERAASRAHITGRAAQNFGFYQPFAAVAIPADRGSWVSSAMLTAGAFATLLMLTFSAGQLGFFPALAATIVAFIPVVGYTALWLWLDRYDPEPAWALAGAFAWGAGVATAFSFVVNTTFSEVAGVLVGSGLANSLGAVISAPLAEEGSKAAGLLLIVLFLRKDFDGMLDGIVYAGMIALGFATVENVLYYGNALNHGQLIGTFVIRGMLGPFGHALYTSMTGIGFGLAREYRRPHLDWLLPIGGFVVAVVLHGFWNLIAGVFGGGGFLVAYVMFWMPLFAVFVGFVVYLMRRELAILRRHLTFAVAEGLITQEHLGIVTSIVRRLSWLSAVLGSPQRFTARRQFLRACSRYGLCLWHSATAASSGGRTMSPQFVPGFREEILELRRLV